ALLTGVAIVVSRMWSRCDAPTVSKEISTMINEWCGAGHHQPRRRQPTERSPHCPPNCSTPRPSANCRSSTSGCTSRSSPAGAGEQARSRQPQVIVFNTLTPFALLPSDLSPPSDSSTVEVEIPGVFHEFFHRFEVQFAGLPSRFYDQQVDWARPVAVSSG